MLFLLPKTQIDEAVPPKDEHFILNLDDDDASSHFTMGTFESLPYTVHQSTPEPTATSTEIPVASASFFASEPDPSLSEFIETIANLPAQGEENSLQGHVKEMQE